MKFQQVRNFIINICPKIELPSTKICTTKIYSVTFIRMNEKWYNFQ